MSEKHAAHHTKAEEKHQDSHAKDDARAQRHKELDAVIDQQIESSTAQKTNAPVVAPRPANQSSGRCVECGKDTAPGQNEVCVDHVRGGNA